MVLVACQFGWTDLRLRSQRSKGKRMNSQCYSSITTMVSWIEGNHPTYYHHTTFSFKGNSTNKTSKECGKSFIKIQEQGI